MNRQKYFESTPSKLSEWVRIHAIPALEFYADPSNYDWVGDPYDTSFDRKAPDILSIKEDSGATASDALEVLSLFGVPNEKPETDGVNE